MAFLSPLRHGEQLCRESNHGSVNGFNTVRACTRTAATFLERRTLMKIRRAQANTLSGFPVLLSGFSAPGLFSENHRKLRLPFPFSRSQPTATLFQLIVNRAGEEVSMKTSSLSLPNYPHRMQCFADKFFCLFVLLSDSMAYPPALTRT